MSRAVLRCFATILNEQIKQQKQKSAPLLLLDPSVYRALADAARLRKILRNLLRHLSVGQSVDPRKDKGLKFRVAVDLRGAAHAMPTAMIGHGLVTQGQVLNPVFQQDILASAHGLKRI